MNEFRIGQKVRIRPDVVPHDCVLPEMAEKYAGKVGTITDEEWGDYRINTTGALWWTARSIEPYIKKKSVDRPRE